MGQDKLGQTNTGVSGSTPKTANQEPTPVPEFYGAVLQPQFFLASVSSRFTLKVTFVCKMLSWNGKLLLVVEACLKEPLLGQ